MNVGLDADRRDIVCKYANCAGSVRPDAWQRLKRLWILRDSPAVIFDYFFSRLLKHLSAAIVSKALPHSKHIFKWRVCKRTYCGKCTNKLRIFRDNAVNLRLLEHDL